MRAHDEPVDAPDQPSVEPAAHGRPEADASIDEQREDAVDLLVGEAELVLVGLVGPQVGGRALAQDGRGYAEVTRELAYLRLVEVADRVDRQAMSPYSVP